MTLNFGYLDCTYGLLRWGCWQPSDRQPYVGCYIDNHRDGCNPYWMLLDPRWDQTSSERLISARNICLGRLQPDSASCAGSYALQERDPTGSSTPDLTKITERRHRYIIALYQALIERFLISRMLTGDDIDSVLHRRLPPECVDYELSPLMCFLDSIPGRISDLRDIFTRDIDARQRAGAIGDKVSDGRFAQALVSDILSFIRSPHSLFGGDVILFPHTPTREADGHLPEFGAGVFQERSWFSKSDVSDPAFLRGSIEERVAALERRVMPHLGAGDFHGSHTDSWLSDLSLRKENHTFGIKRHTISDAPLFNAVVCAAFCNLGFSSGEMYGIREAFTAKNIRTDAGDASGDFAATPDDYCSATDLACGLAKYDTLCLTCQKLSVVPVGYAMTVLGSFGQNSYQFQRASCDLWLFRRHRVTGSRTVSFVPFVSVCSCGEEVFNAFGGNPCKEVITTEFIAEEIHKNMYAQTLHECTSVGIGATVGGYGGQLPWIGGNVYLYVKPGFEDMAWKNVSGRCIPVESLIRGDEGRCGWELFYMLPVSGGQQNILFCFSWNCTDTCGVPVTCAGSAQGRVGPTEYYSAGYPSRTVLRSKLIDYIRDIHAYYVVQDLANKFPHTAVLQTGFYPVEMTVNYLKELARTLSIGEESYYLQCRTLRLLRCADQYAKSDNCIVSTGFNTSPWTRKPGEPLNNVRRPTQWPITCSMVFCGDGSLIDSRDEREMTDVVNRSAYVTGYWPAVIQFGDCADQYHDIKAVIVCDYTGGYQRYIENPPLESFRCYAGGADYEGFLVGIKRLIGNFGPCRNKWEPYTLATEHHIRFGQAFGIVRWDYKVMSRAGCNA